MGNRSTAVGDDALRGGLGSVGISAIDHHRSAVLGQQVCDRCTDAPRAADHDGAAVGEQSTHSSLPKVIASRFQ